MKEISYIEVIPLVRELKELIGSRVEKIYHKNNDIFILLYHPLLKKLFLKITPTCVYLTEYKEEFPEVPSHFCMFLRKHLLNSRLKSVLQLGFERAIEFSFEKEGNIYYLICEIFGGGNVILCDSSKKILIPLKSQTWRDRIIRHGELYRLPPSIVSEDISFSKFKQAILNSGKSQIVKAIAIGLKTGGKYAEEICFVSDVEKQTDLKDLTDEEFRILFDTYLKLIEKAKQGEIKANVVFENKKPKDVQPFLLEIYELKEKKMFETFNKALDFFFAEFQEGESEEKSAIAKEIAKQELILKQHENYLNELLQSSQELKKKADFIYQNLGKLDEIFHTIRDARERNIPWDEIISKIEEGKRQGNVEAQMIKEIIPDEGRIVIDFNSGISLDFRISITENANNLYEKAKKMESKIEGVKKAIEETKKKIENLKKAKEEIVIKKPVKIEKKEKEWYEKFHWFFTSEGKLVIAGRDAIQNEILIKKYLEEDDIVFHADVYGSPFAIMKKGKESTEEEKREAAIFTLCHSRAWQNNRIESVYWVYPHQVSKRAPSGEYIAKGAFMIYGRKNYIKDLELKYCVGVNKEFKVVSGPIDNIRRRAKYYAVLIPGDLNKDELAKQIKEFLISIARESDKELIKQIDIEDIKQHCINKSNIFGAVR